jgi:3-mercaptopyruvate sulfurtransferase SseA
LQVDELFGADGRPLPAEQIRDLVGDAREIVAYCHSGSRSALATLALRSAGYDARNYAGSWHDWSRGDPHRFPAETSGDGGVKPRRFLRRR